MSRVYRNSNIYRRRTSLYEQLYPLFDVSEISSVLTQCGIEVSEDSLVRPSVTFMKKTIEDLVSTFLGLTPEILQTRIEYAIKKNETADPAPKSPIVANGSADTNGKQELDTLPSLLLILLIRKGAEFFRMCGIHDFSLLDLTRPEPNRVQKILSATVNFIRYRNSKADEIDDIAVSAQTEMDKWLELDKESEDLKKSIADLKKELETPNNKSLEELNAINSEIEKKLRELKKTQEELTSEHTRYKNEKNRLIAHLEDINYVMFNQTEQLEKLKDYNQVDISSLNDIIVSLKDLFNTSSQALKEIETKNDNVRITVDSLGGIEHDLRGLYKTLEEIQIEILKHDKFTEELNDLQEKYDQLHLETTALDRQLQHASRQVVLLDEKYAKLKAQSEDKAKKKEELLVALGEEYNQSAAKRREKEQDILAIKDQLAVLENRMKQRRLQHQKEVSSCEMAIAKLNAHLKLYLTEMTKKLEAQA